MSLFFIYLIQVNIALSLFYFLYAIVLKRDTFLRLRRFFFLSVIVFSLLYPFFTIPALSNVWTSRSSDFQEAAVSVMIGEPGQAVIVEGEGAAPVAISWEKILSLFYITVTFVFVVRFLFQLLSIYGVWTKSEKVIISGIPVYQLKSDITPFSFFNLIFIHTGKHSEAELSQILLHEQMHVRQRHSIDIMLIELVCLFSWWNPFVWLMKREMAINLEYLADNGVLREGVDSREYQYHLLRLTYHETAVQIVNNFNVSQLKQRIMMMNKARSSTMTLVKYLLVVPLFLLFVMANSIYAAQNEDKTVAIQFADEGLQELPQPTIEAANLPEPPPEKKKAEEVFIVVENQPEFPGGPSAMMKFLADNFRYPVRAQERGAQGRVICDFQVMKDGSISNVSVLDGADPSLDAEVMRVISSMPKWKSGTQRGNAVNVRAVLPVVFRLEGDNPQDDLTSEERESLFKSEVLDGLKKIDGMMIIDEVVVVGYGSGPRQVQEVTGQDKKKGTAGEELFGVVSESELAYLKAISDNIRYPVIAQENGITGLVKAVYSVSDKGKVSNVKITQGVDPSLDSELIRVLNLLPPDVVLNKVGGKANPAVEASVYFRLQNEKSSPASPVKSDVVVVGYGG